jgi:DNA-binding NtrC family response regulator
MAERVGARRPMVLVVDDEKIVLDGIKEQLRRRSGDDYAVEIAESGAEALELLAELDDGGETVAVILSDHLMPGMRGTDLLTEVHRRYPRILTVLLTGQADVSDVGAAVNEARLYRYLGKPWSEADLAMTVREAVRRHALDLELEDKQRELERLNRELRDALATAAMARDADVEESMPLAEVPGLDDLAAASRWGEDGPTILGGATGLKRVMELTQQVAASDSTVLIQGESGTGKDLVARAVHHLSARRDRALVALNCAALAPTLVESELFGHERGAFSGATARRIGRFELAHESTLFLDEIGELPLELQGKLLRVLQEGEFERLGDSRTRKVDVRVVAATNRDLRADVAAGRFRQDLFYRLEVFPLRGPPLRDRPGDVPALALAFARRFAARTGKHVEAVSTASLKRLELYDWPGNVRELEHVIERAVLLATGPVLDVELPEPSGPRSGARAEGDGPVSGAGAAAATLREMEVAMIRAALEQCNWVIGGKAGAARKLDIAPSTLRERIARYGIGRARDGGD